VLGVGSRLRGQLLSGSTHTEVTPSSMVTGSKQVKKISDNDGVKDGGKASSVEDRTPVIWRQSNHGTVGRRCCHGMEHHRGPRVHRLNVTVDVQKTQSPHPKGLALPSKQTVVDTTLLNPR